MINYRFLCSFSNQCNYNVIKLNLLKQNTIKSNFFKRHYASGNILELSARGLWKDRFPPVDFDFEKNLTNKSLTVYGGFDPTADSLHIGNLLVLNALLHFQRGGHKVIALIGSATARVGDPSGHKSERPSIPVEQIEHNSFQIKKTIQRIFDNHENYIWSHQNLKGNLHPIQLVDNYEWLKNLNLIDFLRDVGSHVRMNKMLSRSVVETELKADRPLSFREFSYQLMQAYDWWYLYKNFNCTIQVGGSDQTGNIMTGHQLITKLEKTSVTGLTLPLITSESGDKWGKSSGTPVWLDKHKMSPFEFYQFFLRVKDSEVENYLKLLTFSFLHEIEDAMYHQKVSARNLAPHNLLAKQLTLLVHGEEGLKLAKQATQLLFGGDASALIAMHRDDIILLFSDACVNTVYYDTGMTILDMAMKAKCFPTVERAVDTIEKGGFRVNMAVVNEPNLNLIPSLHILPNRLSIVRVGKRNNYIVDWKL